MMLRRQDLLIEVLQEIGLRYKKKLDLRSGFLFKSHPSFQKVVVIGCLTLNPIRENVLINQLRRQLVECVARSTTVISLRGRKIVFVVVKVGIRLGITQM